MFESWAKVEDFVRTVFGLRVGYHIGFFQQATNSVLFLGILFFFSRLLFSFPRIGLSILAGLAVHRLWESIISLLFFPGIPLLFLSVSSFYIIDKWFDQRTFWWRMYMWSVYGLLGALAGWLGRYAAYQQAEDEFVLYVM